MTEELSKRDIEDLSEKNVGLLPEVEEAVDLLRAVEKVLVRAQKACKTAATENAEKSKTGDDPVADATAGTMLDAWHSFRRIRAEIEELAKYA